MARGEGSRREFGRPQADPAALVAALGAGRPGGLAAAGRRAPAEEAIQRAVVELLERAAVPGLVWTHIPSGEARGPGVGGKLKGMGVKPGWPDLLLFRGRRLYGLELKSLSGRLGDSQRDVLQALADQGAMVAVAYGVDDAVACLKGWGLVR